MNTITSLTAREILDSRGTPTIEVTCVLSSGASGVASVPSGASTGIHEAVELRDADPLRYRGAGVLRAVAHVQQEISTQLCGKSFDQATLDNTLIALDGTPNKARLGANAMLGVSMAFARAVTQERKCELYEYLASCAGTKPALPIPMFNCINGGKHADSGLSIQEYMLVPVGFDSYRKRVQVAAEIIGTLKALLHERGYSVSLGDEGGFAPKLGSTQAALALLVEAIGRAGYSTEDVKLALDVAASSFYHEGLYVLQEDGVEITKTVAELLEWYKMLIATYPIISIEDGFAEDDWQGFQSLLEIAGSKLLVVGDDLTVTNVDRIKEAKDMQAINAVLIKLNQIGTVSETLQAITCTTSYGWVPIISHRSGETTDTFIADLAAGLGCPYIKAGSLARGERICKYNRLLEIETLL